MDQQTQSGPNRRVGSIEHVGDDGFIVEATDISDPAFFGGKRLFKNYDDLLRFLAEYLLVYKSKGNTYGIKPPGWTPDELEAERRKIAEETNGGNGASRLSPVAGGV